MPDKSRSDSAEQKRLQKRVQTYKKDEKKILDKVKFCQIHPRARGCAYYLRRYQKDERVVQQARTNGRDIVNKIVKSRETHIKTFPEQQEH